jgi:hypothetical protein
MAGGKTTKQVKTRHEICLNELNFRYFSFFLLEASVSSDEDDEDFFEFDFQKDACTSSPKSPSSKVNAPSPDPPIVENEEQQFSDHIDEDSSGDDEDFFEFEFGNSKKMDPIAGRGSAT